MILDKAIYKAECARIRLKSGINSVADIYNLIEELDSGFDKVTAKTCVKIIEKVRVFEDEFWTEDLKTDAHESA